MRVELAAPLQLGALLVPSRDFVVVRVTTRDGAPGVAYSLSRGAPVDVVITEMFAPLLVGENSGDIDAILAACRRPYLSLGDVGLVGQALSLLDIALWDVKARKAGVPLWRLLGGGSNGTRAPVMLVAPYADPTESDEHYAERLAILARAGYRQVKLYPPARPAHMAARLAAIRCAVGSQLKLVVDVSWTWQRASEAIPIVRTWEDFDLAWVEDPIPAQETEEIRALSDAVETPIAVGDEVTVRSHIDRLLETRAVDVLRLDASAIGGISGIRRYGQRAAMARLQVSLHVYPEFHRHCTFALPGLGPLETFPVPCDTWGSHQFVVGDAAAIDASGQASAPTAPGLGLEIDWRAVTALSRRHGDVRASAA